MIQLLQARHDLGGEQPHALLAVFIRHAAVAEHAGEGVAADLGTNFHDFLKTLVRGAPDLEVEEKVGHAFDAAHGLGHLAVVFVALGLGEMVTTKIVVLHGRLPVGTDVASGHLFGAAGILIAEDPAAGDRCRRLGPVGLTVDRPVRVQLYRDVFPRLLRNNQDADTQPGHDLGRLG